MLEQSHRRYPFIKCPFFSLTHCGRVTHICVSKLTTIGSDNGLSPGQRQAIIGTNAGILLIGTLGTNFEILSEIHTFSFKKMHLKNIVCETAAILSRPQCVKCPSRNMYHQVLVICYMICITVWCHDDGKQSVLYTSFNVLMVWHITWKSVCFMMSYNDWSAFGMYSTNSLHVRIFQRHHLPCHQSCRTCRLIHPPVTPPWCVTAPFKPYCDIFKDMVPKKL